MDCIIGYHLNLVTCGVGKFNQTLAGKLKIPLLGIFDTKMLDYDSPLISIKISEFSKDDLVLLENLLDKIKQHNTFEVFLHDFSGTEIEKRLVTQAAVVYCGNSALKAQLQDIRPDAINMWCPGTISDMRRFKNTELSIFIFGMAHKICCDYYHKLKMLLDDTGKTYCLYLSSTLHEGTSFDGPFTVAYKRLEDIFGSNIYFLGSLSDVAIYNYLTKSTFFAVFFDKYARENNTSINIAMLCGSVVVTNLDEKSPFTHLKDVIDINQCQTLPFDSYTLEKIRNEARVKAHRFGWDMLISKIESINTKSLNMPGPIAKAR
jgi:hypothetical protein